MSRTPDELLELLEKAEQGPSGPPVDKWDPPLSGDMDMRIAADGTWYHEGDPIRRHSLVKLFASVLRLDGDDYVLVTPVEKWRIQVDDLPFVAHTVDRVKRGDQTHLLFTTNVDDHVIADEQHPVTVPVSPDGEPRPQILVRRNLLARVGRSAFYQLVNWAEPETVSDETCLVVKSGSMDINLGSTDQ